MNSQKIRHKVLNNYPDFGKEKESRELINNLEHTQTIDRTRDIFVARSRISLQRNILTWLKKTNSNRGHLFLNFILAEGKTHNFSTLLS